MNTKVILLDADVFIHFLKAEKQHLLPDIFSNYDLCMLDLVYEELCKREYTRTSIDELINPGLITLINFPEDNLNILTEYARLQKEGKGQGESACMAVARYRKNIIASSNLRDIRKYCSKFRIIYLTTMDFLAEALKMGILDEEACNAFIKLTKSKGSKLPVKFINDYEYKVSL